MIKTTSGALHTHDVLMTRSSEDVNLDARSPLDRTPVMLAVESGHKELAEWLIDDKDADIHVTNEIGQTPLMMAIDKGDEGMVHLILGFSPNLKQINNAGQTPLDLAREKNFTGITQLLEKRVAKQNRAVNARRQDNLYGLSKALGKRNILDAIQRLQEDRTEKPSSPAVADAEASARRMQKPAEDLSPKDIFDSLDTESLEALLRIMQVESRPALLEELAMTLKARQKKPTRADGGQEL